MVPVATPAPTGNVPKNPRGVFSRTIEWLFSPELFQLKLLAGTAVGVLIIILLAVTCVVFTMRNQARDQLRAHTIKVIRLSSVVEQDISALENAYRGHLLTRKGTYLESSVQLQQLFFTHSEDLTSVLAPTPSKENAS